MNDHEPQRNHQEHDGHKEITVETLTTPPVQMEPAPLTRRIAAGLVDSVVLSFTWIILVVAGGLTYQGIGSTLLSSAADLYLALISLTYFLILEGVFGATVGKFLTKIRVVGKDGEPCTFGASFARNLLRFVDWLPMFYLLGLVVILASPKRQRIGDRLAGTIVSRTPERDINPPPAPFLYH